MIVASTPPRFGDNPDKHRNLLRKRRDDLGMHGRGVGTTGANSLYVVVTADLANLIRPALTEHDSHHGGIARGSSTTGHISGRVWLAHELKTDPSVVSRILTGATAYTGLTLADDVLTACGMTGALRTLDVYANPRMTYVGWIARAADAGIDDPPLEWLLHTAPSKWSTR